MGNSSPNARKPAWHKGHAGFVFFSYYSQIKSARKIDEVTMSSRPKRSESEAERRDLETGQYAAGSNLFLKDPSTSFRSRSTPLGMTGAFYLFTCYFDLSIVLYYSQIKSARKIDEVTMSSRPKRSENEAEWRDLETGQYAAGSNLFLKDPSTSFRSRSTPLGMTGAFYLFTCYFDLSIVSDDNCGLKAASFRRTLRGPTFFRSEPCNQPVIRQKRAGCRADCRLCRRAERAGRLRCDEGIVFILYF